MRSEDSSITSCRSLPRADGRGTEQENLDELFSLAYEELRRLAAAVRRRDRYATLSPTTLVNEAWLKLSRTPAVSSADAVHFRRIAARAMRQVLVSAARRRMAARRSPGAGSMVTFDDAVAAPGASCEEFLALDEALQQLARMNPRHAALVECRFFGGLEMAEISVLLGVSEATLLRDWRAARAWLARQLGRRSDGAAHGS